MRLALITAGLIIGSLPGDQTRAVSSDSPEVKARCQKRGNRVIMTKFKINDIKFIESPFPCFKGSSGSSDSFKSLPEQSTADTTKALNLYDKNLHKNVKFPKISDCTPPKQPST